eukprot:3289235-Ditylum_brightwellii.AAC.1
METVTKIGHITHLHPMKAYRRKYQEQLNKTLKVVADEINEEGDNYLISYGSMTERTKFNYQ